LLFIKRISILLFLIVLSIAVGQPARAASSAVDADHLRVELRVLPQALHPGEAARAGLYFKLEPGWHIYWKNPGDAGLPPHAAWTLPMGLTASALSFPAPKRLSLGPLMDYGYEDEVLFPLTLTVAKSAKPGAALLHVKVDWLVCQDRCLPGKAELELSREIADHPGKAVSSGEDQALFRRFSARLPQPLLASAQVGFQTTAQGFRLTVQTGQRETQAAFFPAEQDIIDNPAPQKLTPTAQGLLLDLKKDSALAANPAKLTGVLELSGGRAFEIVALPGAAATATLAIPSAAAPTAAPANPTAANSAVPPASAPPAQGFWLTLLRISGFAFLGGLVLNLMPCVFPVLFIKGLALVHSGNKERRALRLHGLVYAGGILVSFWVLVAVLLGLRAAGSTLGWGFQFQSPVFLSLMAGLLFFLGLSLAGQFEIGLTLTSAGGSLAQKQGYTGSFFTGVLAVVVATPCTAPFMGAAIGYALAQPAAVTFAVFTALALGLAAPYVALTLHPAWTRILPHPGAWMEILRQAVSVPIFATVIWLAWVLARAYGAALLASLLAGFLLLAIAGWFLGRWPAKRWAAAVGTAILLSAVALYALAPARLAVAPESASAETQGWEPYSAAALARYQAEGRPVFVDFSASWCLSCQVNERVALNRPEAMQAFADRKVALLKADWTRHDEAITQALTALGRSGVPAYALYAPGQSQPQMLPEALTPGIVLDALSKLPKAAR
jgi:thiol:disulfide interchange protein